MKRLLFILLFAAFSLPVYAEPAQETSIEKLLVLTDARKLCDSALADTDAIIETTLRPLLKTEGITAEKRQMLESFLNQYKTIVREEFSWQKTLPDYIRIYREIFTEEEIQSLIAFYESPTGQMFVRKTPLIMDKMNDVLSMKMTVIINRMQAALIETMGTPSR